MEKCRLAPGEIVIIDHIHTNQIEHFKKSPHGSDGQFSCELRAKGKQRPMMLLWEGDNGILYLLYMTTQENYGQCFNLVERQKCKGYIDCSRFFEYPYKLLQGPATRIAPLNQNEWNLVMDRLPPFLRDIVTRMRANHALHQL